ncbi:hypothetical protein [Ligilactobacillus salivarius]|nr:hypothetical protein [Ligilactobacillus salivarius]
MKKFKIILTGICIVLLIMIIINFGMNWWIFDELGNGSDDGWLGFWGGFLGAILAVVGVWWQTNKTIKNEKELMFSQKRPYIIIQESSVRNLAEIKDIFSSKNHTAYADEPVIVIKNLSNNPMFSVKLVFQYDNKKEDIVIDRIDPNSNIGIIINSDNIIEYLKKLGMIYPRQPEERDEFYKRINLIKEQGIKKSFSDNIKALKYFNVENKESEYINAIRITTKNYSINTKYELLKEFSDKYIHNNSILYEIPCKIKVTIYFTTTVREKVKLVFKKEDKKYRYQKNETKLENKGSTFTEKEYDTSDMYESYKLK